MTASAVLRVGSHAPVPLQGTPAVSPDYHPGEVTIILGYTPLGEPVTLTVASLEWDQDLEDAARTAWAGGIVQSGLWTVGFYDGSGEWYPESDQDSPEKAAERVAWLNGGRS